MGLPQNSLLPLWGVLAVLEESPRGIHLDHAAALEVVEPALGLVPLREQVVGCHIVADVVEVAAEGADAAGDAGKVTSKLKTFLGPTMTGVFDSVAGRVDDIAKGGYTFVRLLQTIHDRARKK